MFKVKVTVKVQNVSECLSGLYFFHVSDHSHTISLELLNHFFFFYNKLGMVVYFEAMCHAEKLVHCVQFQGHNEGLYNQIITVPIISSKLLIRLQPELI